MVDGAGFEMEAIRLDEEHALKACSRLNTCWGFESLCFRQNETCHINDGMCFINSRDV